eukprot:1536539-Pleurochrysis_carterae.AAC.1
MGVRGAIVRGVPLPAAPLVCAAVGVRRRWLGWRWGRLRLGVAPRRGGALPCGGRRCACCGGSRRAHYAVPAPYAVMCCVLRKDSAAAARTCSSTPGGTGLTDSPFAVLAQLGHFPSAAFRHFSKSASHAHGRSYLSAAG